MPLDSELAVTGGNKPFSLSHPLYKITNTYHSEKVRVLGLVTRTKVQAVILVPKPVKKGGRACWLLGCDARLPQVTSRLSVEGRVMIPCITLTTEQMFPPWFGSHVTDYSTMAQRCSRSRSACCLSLFINFYLQSDATFLVSVRELMKGRQARKLPAAPFTTH